MVGTEAGRTGAAEARDPVSPTSSASPEADAESATPGHVRTCTLGTHATSLCAQVTQA